MKIDLQKGVKNVGSALEKAAEVGKKAAGDTLTSAQSLVSKAQEENRKALIRKYNPIFPEDYKKEDFGIPNLVMIVDDVVRKGIDVCEGAIGWRSNTKGVEVFSLYDEAIAFSGLHFIPAAVCDLKFELECQIAIGKPAKLHRFDIAETAKKTVIECKCYTWTESGNVPSAKMGFTNEAAFYLSFLPVSIDKVIVMAKSTHPEHNETLADYYFRTNRHLLGDISIMEYDMNANTMRMVGKN